MKILVVMSVWDDKTATGNTFSNWFGGKTWSGDRFSNLFWRAQNPSNSICRDYYRITDIELMKKVFSPQSIGEHFSYFDMSTKKKQSNSGDQEKRLITWLHKHPLHIIYGVMEFLQRNVKWRNHQFILYLSEFSPDVVFTTAAGIGIIPGVIECIREHSNAKIVYYIADDVYEKYIGYPFYRRIPLTKSFEKAIKSADKLYGASELLCEEYGKRFGVEITPLYKGCEFSPVAEKHSDVIKLVYAGNLFYGRDDTLATLAAAISELNKSAPRAMLEIYTGSPVSEEMEKKLNVPGASRIMGQRPYDEIKEILHSTDIVLHVESFEQKQIDYVHYSFSTKIMDCLQSGSVTMAIGPAGIASIEYIRKIPGAIVVDGLQNVQSVLNDVIQHKSELNIMAEKSRAFAVQNHDVHTVRSRLRADFERLQKIE